MPDAPIFTRAGDRFMPTAHAVGPWDPGQLHGGGPAALMADAIQRLAPEMQLARVTYEFLGPVPAAELTVDAQIDKPGGRLQLASASVSVGDRVAMRASATLLRRADIEVPAEGLWTAAAPAAPPDDASHTPAPASREGFHTTGMTLRFANGTSFAQPGPAQAWFALERELVAGAPLAPAARVAAAADFANGVSSVLDWDEWLFINCDLTVSLVRDPVTPWVLLDAVTRIAAAGVGVASATIHDERGPLGQSVQTLFVAPR